MTNNTQINPGEKVRAMGEITPNEREKATKVMMKARIVRNWVGGQLRAFNLDPESIEGKEFAGRAARTMAERLVR